MSEGGQIKGGNLLPSTRGVERRLRRARLLAARTYARGSIPRRAILGGYWDGGSVVRQFMTEQTDG